MLITAGHIWREGQGLVCQHWEIGAPQRPEWVDDFACNVAVFFDVALRWAVEVVGNSQAESDVPPPSPGIAAAALMDRIRSQYFVSGAPAGARSVLERDPEVLNAVSLDLPAALLRLEVVHGHVLRSAFPTDRPVLSQPVSPALAESLLVALGGVLAAASA